MVVVVGFRSDVTSCELERRGVWRGVAHASGSGSGGSSVRGRGNVVGLTSILDLGQFFASSERSHDVASPTAAVAVRRTSTLGYTRQAGNRENKRAVYVSCSRGASDTHNAQFTPHARQDKTVLSVSCQAV